MPEQDETGRVAAPLLRFALGGGQRVRDILGLLQRVGPRPQPVIDRNQDETLRRPARQLVFHHCARTLVAVAPSAAMHHQQYRRLLRLRRQIDVHALLRVADRRPHRAAAAPRAAVSRFRRQLPRVSRPAVGPVARTVGCAVRSPGVPPNAELRGKRQRQRSTTGTPVLITLAGSLMFFSGAAQATKEVERVMIFAQTV